jgi:hypothetical protein
MFKLIKRVGDFRIYSSDKGLIEVKLCLNPNVYTAPGYYLTINNRVPSDVLNKRHSNGLGAVKAAYNALA